MKKKNFPFVMIVETIFLRKVDRARSKGPGTSIMDGDKKILVWARVYVYVCARVYGPNTSTKLTHTHTHTHAHTHTHMGGGGGREHA